jgi:hypothetical protein
MKRVHPNLSQIARVTAIGCLFGLVGCRTPAGGVANPFLAPDRVPPPATRALLPGQAQPYYPGDPLPVMHSATPPDAALSEHAGLAWNAPGGAVPSMSGEQRRSPSLAFSNETTVSVPSDEGDLRFTVSQPAETTQMATLEAASPQAMPTAALARARTVLPASYSGPIVSEPSFNGSELNLADPIVASPWRPPQVPPSIVPAVAVPMSPGISAPEGMQRHSIGVRLRAVPSPPPEPTESTSPRIRLPNYFVPQAIPSAAAMPMAPVYAIPMRSASGGIVQAVQISPLDLAAVPQPPVSEDGFRPRSAMR